jgi:DNA-binding response OmpR family regulator
MEGKGGKGPVKVLVADSDTDQVTMEVAWLRTQGYDVKHALSPERFRSLWVEHCPDLAMVEPRIAGVDTLALCRELRLTHDALVLATVTEQDPDVHIRCLMSGADAYVVKPFLPAMLLAHIQALSRRVRNSLVGHPPSIVNVGAIRVDALRHQVSVRGKLKRLTPIESKILYLLAVNANNVCTLPQVVEQVWGYGDKSDTLLIRVHIRHLREKIEDDPSNPRHIVTIAGSGYMLVPRMDPQIDGTASGSIPSSAEVRIPGSEHDMLSILDRDQGVTEQRPESPHPQSRDEWPVVLPLFVSAGRMEM